MLHPSPTMPAQPQFTRPDRTEDLERGCIRPWVRARGDVPHGGPNGHHA